MHSQRSSRRAPPERTILNIRVVNHNESQEPTSEACTSRRESASRWRDASPSLMSTRRQSRPKYLHREQDKENISSAGNTSGVIKKSPRPAKKVQSGSISTGASTPANSQAEQIAYIESMLAKLWQKQQKQAQSLTNLQHVPQQLAQARQLNQSLREQLLEMKQLMKCLLLQREQSRMFTFYQEE